MYSVMQNPCIIWQNLILTIKNTILAWLRIMENKGNMYLRVLSPGLRQDFLPKQWDQKCSVNKHVATKITDKNKSCYHHADELHVW